MFKESLKDFSIALIIPDFDYGGEEKRVVFFANTYAKYFKKVYVIAPEGKSLNLLDASVIHFNQNVRNYMNIPKVISFLNKNQVKILQGHKRAVTPYLLCAEKFLKIHCNFNFDNIYLNNVIYRFLMPKTIFYLSDKMRGFYKPLMKDKENITINMGGDVFSKYNSTDVNEIRKKLGLDGKFVILSLGRLSAQKNHKLLLKALSTLNEKNDISCLIAGSGPLEKELKELACSLQLNDFVHFLGHRSDTEQLMNASDVLVQSSIFEGFPNVFIEAVSTGLPIISTNVGSSESLVLNNGILIESQNYIDLANAINEMHYNLFHYKKNAEILRKSSFFAKFHKNEMAANYIKMYETKVLNY